MKQLLHCLHIGSDEREHWTWIIVQSSARKHDNPPSCHSRQGLLLHEQLNPLDDFIVFRGEEFWFLWCNWPGRHSTASNFQLLFSSPPSTLPVVFEIFCRFISQIAHCSTSDLSSSAIAKRLMGQFYHQIESSVIKMWRSWANVASWGLAEKARNERNETRRPKSIWL